MTGWRLLIFLYAFFNTLTCRGLDETTILSLKNEKAFHDGALKRALAACALAGAAAYLTITDHMQANYNKEFPTEKLAFLGSSFMCGLGAIAYHCVRLGSLNQGIKTFEKEVERLLIAGKLHIFSP